MRANSPLFEITRGLVRFNHVVRCIVNANHSIMSSASNASRTCV